MVLTSVSLSASHQLGALPVGHLSHLVLALPGPSACRPWCSLLWALSLLVTCVHNYFCVFLGRQASPGGLAGT